MEKGFSKQVQREEKKLHQDWMLNMPGPSVRDSEREGHGSTGMQRMLN